MYKICNSIFWILWNSLREGVQENILRKALQGQLLGISLGENAGNIYFLK